MTGSLAGIVSFGGPRPLYFERYVELKGQLTPKGRYGHMGFSDRKLTVDQVLVSKMTSAGTANESAT